MILTRLEYRLMKQSELVTKKACDVNSYVTKEEIEELRRLERAAGRKYDAINQEWEELGG